jgi:hypothetical protein
MVTARGFVLCFFGCGCGGGGGAGLGWGVARGTLELAAAANGVGECGRVERGPVPEMAAAPARGFPAGVGSEPTCH